MIAMLACTPEPGGRLAVVFPPWYGAGQIFRAIAISDARLVRFGGTRWIAIIAPSARPRALQERLAAQGALAFINPLIVGGCDIATPVPPSAR